MIVGTVLVGVMAAVIAFILSLIGWPRRLGRRRLRWRCGCGGGGFSGGGGFGGGGGGGWAAAADRAAAAPPGAGDMAIGRLLKHLFAPHWRQPRFPAVYARCDRGVDRRI